MTEDEDYPERGYNTRDVEALREDATPPKKGLFRRHWGKILLAAVILVPIVGLTVWVAVAMAFSYSTGDRTGYVQRFAKEGWLCKTWEGQVAMVNVPGQLANTFNFTVRDDSIAAVINEAAGKLVTLSYAEHRGLPFTCFGETDFFVNGVKVVGP